MENEKDLTHRKKNRAAMIFFSEFNTTQEIIPIQDAAYYIFKKKDFYTYGSIIPIFHIFFYKTTKPYFIDAIKLEAHPQNENWTNAHEEYCNALLDHTIKIEDKQATHAVIKIPDPWYKDYGRMRFPRIYLYHNETVIGEDDFFIPDSATEEEITDLRNPHHFYTKNCGPQTLFSNVQYVIFNNGYYPEQVRTYNEHSHSSLKLTWQHYLAKTTVGCSIATSVLFMICIENMLKNYL